MANCKICIKDHRYDICKAPKNHTFSNCSKIWKYNLYMYQESIYQYGIRKYYTTCLIKKGKSIDCEDLSSTYTPNSQFFFKLNKNHLLIKSSYYVKHLLSV